MSSIPWLMLLAVVGIALIVCAPVIVAVSSPGDGALGIAAKAGSMLALLFALFAIGLFVPYWRGWFDYSKDDDIRDVYPLIPWAAVVGFALGFLGGLLVSAGRYILRAKRGHDGSTFGFALGFLGGLVVSAGRYILRVNRRP